MSKQISQKGAEFNDSATHIPENAGISVVAGKYSPFLLRIYITLAVFALASFILDWDPRVQSVGLAVLFPGGGLVGIGGWWILAFVYNLIFFAASLFLWFATANIILPFVAWPGQALIFPILSIKYRAGYSVVFVPAIAVVTSWFIFRFLQQESATTRQRRREGNKYLASLIKELASTAGPHKFSAELEIQPEELSQLRCILDIAMQDQDDCFVPFIDPLPTMRDSLRPGSSQQAVCTILQGWLSLAGTEEGDIQILSKESSQLLEVGMPLGTEYEPVKKDNIMLTAFLLLATGLYESATGDHTFSQDNALELIIDNNHSYRHSARTLAQALMGNFSISSYCLYPCEPNWIYTFCNLNGMNALLAHDANTDRHDVELVRASFHKALVEDFLDESGSAHPIRSYPTGLRLPNIVGAANEFSVSCLAEANFPDLSLRCYAIARHEYMEFDSQYRVSYKNIQNGDRLDPGNYGTSMALVFSSSLMAAHEHGDEEVARRITALIDIDQALRRIEKDGVVWYEGVLLFMKCQLLRSRLWLRSGWSRFLQPLSDAVQRGPYLVDVNYAEALVAKAISSTGDDLDIVLYPGAESKSTSISIKQLKPSSEYVTKDGMRFASDEQGEARISVQLDGRTAIQIVPFSL